MLDIIEVSGVRRITPKPTLKSRVPRFVPVREVINAAEFLGMVDRLIEKHGCWPCSRESRALIVVKETDGYRTPRDWMLYYISVSHALSRGGVK